MIRTRSFDKITHIQGIIHVNIIIQNYDWIYFILTNHDSQEGKMVIPYEYGHDKNHPIVKTNHVFSIFESIPDL